MVFPMKYRKMSKIFLPEIHFVFAAHHFSGSHIGGDFDTAPAAFQVLLNLGFPASTNYNNKFKIVNYNLLIKW